jgi:hypothetical protein
MKLDYITEDLGKSLITVAVINAGTSPSQYHEDMPSWVTPYCASK